MRGTVARVVSDRGFGFVRDGNGTERFFHLSKVVGGVSAFQALQPGDTVEFDPEQGDKGERAVNVRAV